MSDRLERIPVQLPNGRIIHVEATPLGGEEEVAFQTLKFDEIGEIIKGLASTFTKSIESLRPTRTGVEFSLELGVETGKLTALLVQGSGKANLKVMLEWGQSKLELVE
uniref:Trypsin-co-occurring domain-containing protein n=1 Tax=Candidatus Kentrum sp. UNK TaxID=2126344 RepID=A0A451ASU6_9GAMM|nr:MAG: hypothetical protein BECKUNK1418G_GA0071005_107612 [Candidatus Kentron sp. UNK]VFK69082.1 MAG: hypothetical protein BECKUNK1418H_GA0071006_10108 [Candidatus Kentron sp. UNK]